MITVLLAVLLFFMMIFPHELGHFVAAKALDVKVNEFAFGMGPALWRKQKGETLYSIRIFPIGGYNAIEGENSDSDDARAFGTKPAWIKIVILIAGSMMNFIVAFIVLSIALTIIGSPLKEVGTLMDGGPAETAGIRKGDVVISVDDEKIENWNALTREIRNNNHEMTFKVDRNGKLMEFKIKPVKKDGNNLVGISPAVSHNPIRGIASGAIMTGKMTISLFDILGKLLSGGIKTNNLSGPVGIVSVVHQSESYGWYFFCYLLSFISINMAIFNLLPFPALDGGRILFVIIRRVTGKAISDKTEAAVHAVGMLLLFGLMIYVTWNDVLRIFFN